jgi:plastocyanin
MRRGENWIPYRYWEGRYHPYRVFRQGHYYRVIYIFVYPNYFPQYIPDEGPIYQPWMSQMYVSIQNYSFNPSYLRVDRGTTVTWTNGDSVPHTVTTNGPSIDSFDSGVMYPGSSYSHTFNLNGAFGYHCRLHPYMRGEVQVGNPY